MVPYFSCISEWKSKLLRVQKGRENVAIVKKVPCMIVKKRGNFSARANMIHMHL